MDLIYTNNSREFPAQTINIDLSGYYAIGIEWVPWADADEKPSTMFTIIVCSINGSINNRDGVLSFYGENHHWRYVGTTKNSIVFHNGKLGTVEYSHSAVPRKIYGIKIEK